jgi:adenylate kinase family enzyme
MEGNYAGSLDLRLPRADTVIWFDYPTEKCLRRVMVTYGQVRADMAPGCPERFDLEFLRYVWQFNRIERPKIVAALAKHAGDPVVFRRDGEVAQFLERLS